MIEAVKSLREIVCAVEGIMPLTAWMTLACPVLMPPFAVICGAFLPMGMILCLLLILGAVGMACGLLTLVRAHRTGCSRGVGFAVLAGVLNGLLFLGILSDLVSMTYRVVATSPLGGW